MEDEDYRTQRARLEALLAEARERARVAGEECSLHFKAIEALDGLRLARLTDEEILGSEDLRRWVCKLSGQDAYQRYRRLQEQDLPRGLWVEGQDGRDEWYGQQLPILRVGLQRRQPVEGLPDAIRAWADRWALGRPDMPLSIIEQSLSVNGSWSMVWDIASDACRVEQVYYGSRRTKHDGHLADALAWVARHAWYEDPNADDD